MRFRVVTITPDNGELPWGTAILNDSLEFRYCLYVYLLIIQKRHFRPPGDASLHCTLPAHPATANQ